MCLLRMLLTPGIYRVSYGLICAGRSHQSEVGEFQFSFFLLSVYIIAKLPFTTDLIEIGQLIQKIWTVEWLQTQ